MDFYITGITGFLGSHLVEALLASDEVTGVYGLSRRWAAQEKLAARHTGDKRLRMVTGDIRDRHTARRFLELGSYAHRSYLIHAAAYKHVPLAQTNVHECTSINVDGTQIVVEEAHAKKKFESFVFIGTDKAVQPVNVYGQTKAIAEQALFSSYGSHMHKFVCRFGNVFGSTGSVVEKWAERLEMPEPYFLIADQEMTRYWYPINDAVRYVLAASLGTGEDALVIPRLKSSKISDLLAAYVSIAKAAGKTPTIKTFPVRAGEKLHEAMTHEEEVKYADLTPAMNGQVIKMVLNKYMSPRPAPDAVNQLLSSDLAQKYTVVELVKMVSEYMFSRQK